MQNTRSRADRLLAELEAHLPRDFRQFDYKTISDVILNVRYTSLDGGDKLRKIAANSVTELSQDAGLFAVFDGARFPERVVQNHALYPGRSKLSYGADPGFPAASVSTNGAKSDQPLSSGDAIGTMKSPAAKELDDLPAGD